MIRSIKEAGPRILPENKHKAYATLDLLSPGETMVLLEHEAGWPVSLISASIGVSGQEGSKSSKLTGSIDFDSSVPAHLMFDLIKYQFKENESREVISDSGAIHVIDKEHDGVEMIGKNLSARSAFRWVSKGDPVEMVQETFEANYSLLAEVLERTASGLYYYFPRNVLTQQEIVFAPRIKK